MNFPLGTLVVLEDQVYRIGDKAYPLLSWRAVESWGQPIIVVQGLDLETSAARIGFRPTSILTYSNDYYFIEGNRKRLIASPDFWELGFNKFEAIEVSKSELDFHPDGDNLE